MGYSVKLMCLKLVPRAGKELHFAANAGSKTYPSADQDDSLRAGLRFAPVLRISPCASLSGCMSR